MRLAALALPAVGTAHAGPGGHRGHHTPRASSPGGKWERMCCCLEAGKPEISFLPACCIVQSPSSSLGLPAGSAAIDSASSMVLGYGESGDLRGSGVAQTALGTPDWAGAASSQGRVVSPSRITHQMAGCHDSALHLCSLSPFFPPRGQTLGVEVLEGVSTVLGWGFLAKIRKVFTAMAMEKT